MVGPNKQFDEETALDTALTVFWNQGYEATSMQDLVNAMKVNRASLYQTFGNKERLFNTCMDRYITRSVQFMRSLDEQPGAPLQNLKQAFIILIDQSLENKWHGCLINNTAIEMAPHQPDMAAKLRQVWEEFEWAFTRLIDKAKQRGDISTHYDSTQLAILLNTQLQGMMVKSKVDTPRESLLANIELIFDLIQQEADR